VSGVPDLGQFLNNPAIRQSLETAAARSGREVVIATDDEPVTDLVARLGARADRPVLIAIPRLRWSFVLLALERLAEDSEDGDGQYRFAKGTSVGMLYDAIELAGGEAVEGAG
jgi:antitoxin (DNA-binding transcriptional repressor) of toxin-antitoxin stability system